MSHERKCSSRNSNSKHARDGRNEERQKLRESHETIQRLTSQVQELQERMNHLNVSGESHEVDSNDSGNFSHVPSQPTRIPSLRSLLSCDKCLQPELWNPSGLQENVFFFFANPRSTLESLQIPYQGTHSFMTSCAADQAPALISTGRLVAREDERIGSTIPMPIFARTPPTTNSFVPVDSTEFYCWAAKTAGTRNVNFINSVHHHHFDVGR